jgi:hypothetical protein
MNYPWHQAPWWATHAATDADGLRYWHQTTPTIDVSTNEWAPNYPANFLLIGRDGDKGPCPHWRDTLEPRPETNAAITLTFTDDLSTQLHALSTKQLDDLSTAVDRTLNNFAVLETLQRAIDALPPHLRRKLRLDA